MQEAGWTNDEAKPLQNGEDSEDEVTVFDREKMGPRTKTEPSRDGDTMPKSKVYCPAITE